MMLSVTRRVARAAGVCESVLPPSTARWTRTLILPTAGASGSMVGDSICRPTARPHPESASVAPEFAVPEHRWAEEGDAATPDGPFALMAVPKRKVTPSKSLRLTEGALDAKAVADFRAKLRAGDTAPEAEQVNRR